ncbi:MAG: hypothetical protein EOP42_02065 [Sphingobacteriaceae bacterium]|nr:MAG: hypothetical protein EOP42_02065 [Sphingobacteriaceae bacterium]
MMKKSDYFYSVFFVGIFALIVYGFINYFWMMAGLIALSSTFSFVVFLIQTHIKVPVADAKTLEEPIEFSKPESQITYYQMRYQHEGLKQANGAN